MMAHAPFSGSIPDDRLYCLQHDMWVQPAEDGTVLIGATAFGVFLAGEIIAFTSKPCGADIALGRGMGIIECRKTVLAVHAPLSFVLFEGNETAEERPQRINADPYGSGWMARGHPTRWDAELPMLVDAVAYRRHILSIEPESCFV
jgi:glycine cleavage system H protein